MLNNRFVHERSQALARRLAHQSPLHTERIRQAWQAVIGRRPDAEELALSEQPLEQQIGNYHQLLFSTFVPYSIHNLLVLYTKKNESALV